MEPKAIIECIYFYTNEEFVQWQKEEKRNIIQVSPVVTEMNGNTTDTTADFYTKPGIFVTYHTKYEKENNDS